jgi:hypothetical protein
LKYAIKRSPINPFIAKIEYMQRQGWAILILFFILVAGSLSAQAENDIGKSNAICFMSGDIVDSKGEAKGLAGMHQMLRLRFDAGDLESCQVMVQGHCRRRVLNVGYKVIRLSGYFKKTGAKELKTTFRLNQICDFEVYEDLK